MRGNRRAILVDIFERNLNPKDAHTFTDKSGRMVETKKVETKQADFEQANEKVIFASVQKSQVKKEKKIEEKLESDGVISDIVNDLKPAEIVEEQDGFLIPSIAKKVANGSTIEEEVIAVENEIVANDDSATKKAKKKKKSLNQD